jgi:hypothetical protein
MTHPYHSFTEDRRRTCFTRIRNLFIRIVEPDALVTHESLMQKKKHLAIMRLAIEDEIKEHEKEGRLATEQRNVVWAKACATQCAIAKKRHAEVVGMWENVSTLVQKLQDASLYAPLTVALKDAHLTMDDMLKRIQPDQIDTLMDCLRDQSDDLHSLEEILARPIASTPEAIEEIPEEEEKEEVDEEFVTIDIISPPERVAALV